MSMHQQPSAHSPMTWAACLVALFTSVGSVYLSVGMALEACPLCFYQRTFAFATFGVLFVGLLVGGMRTGVLSLLALPLALGGLGVAVFHCYLEAIGTLECPNGVLELGSVPRQSVGALTLLAILLVVDVGRGIHSGSIGPVAFVGAVILGLAFTAASISSAPPLKIPTEPYSTPMKGCRPRFQG